MNKLNSKAMALLADNEVYVAQFVKIDFKRESSQIGCSMLGTGQLILRFKKDKGIPRKNEYFTAVVLEKELCLPKNWNNISWRDLRRHQVEFSEVHCIWQGKSDDKGFLLCGFTGVSIEMADFLTDKTGCVIVLGPQEPPMAYYQNLIDIVNNSSESMPAKEILDFDDRRVAWDPLPINSNKEQVKGIVKSLESTSQLIFQGPPGTGKTLLAKAVASEAEVPFFSISGSAFVEMFVGLGASRVRKLFEKARKLAPCIVFIDEIDAIGARRTGNSGGESENNQTLNQLLVEMDGFSSEETIIVLAATNRPEMLDKALLRPGRFDRQITIPAPDIRGRLEILKIHAKDKKVSDDVNLESIAEDTAGFTGAELANILNEAAIIATINKHEEIENDDIEEAVKKVTVGLEKKERVISDKDKKLTAYHEAGHAVVGRYLPTQSNVKEVSIIPRGVAGGYTMYKSDEDKYYISKTEMQERLTALLGGRAAEKLVLNDISTGASNDIEVATNIARDMVTKYGMSDVLGPIDFKGKEPYEMQLFGENIGDKIGQEVKLLIDTAYERAQQLLIEHRDKLEIIAQTLLEREKINETEFIIKIQNLTKFLRKKFKI